MKHVITETEGGLFIQLRGIGYVQKHYDDFNFHKSSDVVGMIICAAWSLSLAFYHCAGVDSLTDDCFVFPQRNAYHVLEVV